MNLKILTRPFAAIGKLTKLKRSSEPKLTFVRLVGSVYEYVLSGKDTVMQLCIDSEFTNEVIDMCTTRTDLLISNDKRNAILYCGLVDSTDTEIINLTHDLKKFFMYFDTSAPFAIFLNYVDELYPLVKNGNGNLVVFFNQDEFTSIKKPVSYLMQCRFDTLVENELEDKCDVDRIYSKKDLYGEFFSDSGSEVNETEGDFRSCENWNDADTEIIGELERETEGGESSTFTHSGFFD